MPGLGVDPAEHIANREADVLPRRAVAEVLLGDEVEHMGDVDHVQHGGRPR